MNIEIKITGGGSPKKVAQALRDVAEEIEKGEYKQRLKEKGECEWEDNELFTRITKENE